MAVGATAGQGGYTVGTHAERRETVGTGTDRQVARAVCDTRKELTGPGAWTQGTYEGWFGSHCILGAIDVLREERRHPPGVLMRCEEELAERLPGDQGVAAFNDGMFRTQSQVIEALWRVESQLYPEDHALCTKHLEGGSRPVSHAGVGVTPSGRQVGTGGKPAQGVVRTFVGRQLAVTSPKVKAGVLFGGTGIALAVIAPVLFVVCLVATVLGVAGVVVVKRRTAAAAIEPAPQETPCMPEVVEDPEPVRVPVPVSRPRRRELGESVATPAPVVATSSGPVAAPVAARPERVVVPAQRATPAALGSATVATPVPGEVTRDVPAATVTRDVSWRGRRRRVEAPRPLEVPADADLTSARRDYRDPEVSSTRREIARVYLVAAGADMAVEERARLVAAEAPELEPAPVVVSPAPTAEDMTPWLYATPPALEAPRPDEGPSAAEVMASWKVAPEPVAEPVVR